MILFGLSVLAAFCVGVAAHRGTTCGVIAIRALVQQGDLRLLIGFGAATGFATLVVLPSAWLLDRAEALPGNAAVAFPLLVGGVLLGIGALINGACMLGSLWRLGNGEAHLLGLVPGVAIGHLAAGLTGWRATRSPNGFALPSVDAILFIGLGGFVAFGTALWLWRQGALGRSSALTMATLGIAGGFLFVAHPGWTWSDAVGAGASQWLMPMRMILTPGWSTMVATLLGAILSGWYAGHFRVCWNGAQAFARSLLGGIAMAIGAFLIPGGNDALLLGAAPAGVSSALLAFVLMNGTILLIELVHGRTRRD